MTLNSSCVSESEDRQSTTTVSAGHGLLCYVTRRESIQDLSPITASGRFPELTENVSKNGCLSNRAF